MNIENLKTVLKNEDFCLSFCILFIDNTYTLDDIQNLLDVQRDEPSSFIVKVDNFLNGIQSVKQMQSFQDEMKLLREFISVNLSLILIVPSLLNDIRFSILYCLDTFKNEYGISSIPKFMKEHHTDEQLQIYFDDFQKIMNMMVKRIVDNLSKLFNKPMDVNDIFKTMLQPQMIQSMNEEENSDTFENVDFIQYVPSINFTSEESQIYNAFVDEKVNTLPNKNMCTIC